MTGLDEHGRCIKCKSGSGDDWRQCNGSCPVPLSPHYIPADDERNFMKIRVASGKYTFVHTRGDMPIEILRHGKQWISLHDGADALTAMMAEIDAARVVLETARGAGLTNADEIEIVVRATEEIADFELPLDTPLEWKPHPLHAATDSVVTMAAAFAILLRENAKLRAAVAKHDRLVDDSEPPSEWAK